MKKRIVNRIVSIAAMVTITTAAVFNISGSAYAGTSLNQTTESSQSFDVASNTLTATTQDATTSGSSTDSNTTGTTDSTANWPEVPELSAGYAILMDADTGAILYDKNSHTKTYPASITKIMTGLLTVENCSLDETVTFSSEAANSVTWEDSNIGTKAGEQYTVEQSLYALLMYSANEIAYGLAEHVGGNLSTFVDMMNKRAKELGANDTHFNNASGLSDPNHYTTAYDLALIGKACFNNATFITFDSHADNYIIPPTNMTPTARTIFARNQLLKGKPFYYEYCKGGKTGFTDESGYTLISYAEKNDMRLICVVLQEPNSDARFTDSQSLYEYGFNNFKKTTISNSDVSSLFNSSTYYNSRVYGNNALTFDLNASFVDLPNNVSTSDLGIKLNENTTSDDSSDSGYATSLNFTYGDHTVGNATLTVATDSSQSSVSSNLPYEGSSISNVPKARRCLVINVWFALVLIILIYIGIRIYIYRKNNQRFSFNRRNARRRSRGRRGRGNSRNLHF